MTTMFRRKKRIMREREQDPIDWYEVWVVITLALIAVLVVYMGDV